MSPPPSPQRPGRSPGVMALEALTLAVMSFLHLSGLLDGGRGSSDPSPAGIAEALICLVLTAGAIALLRAPVSGRRVALAATGFAILGFAVGLTETVRGGEAIDIAYHATVLPILLLTLLALVAPAPYDQLPGSS